MKKKIIAALLAATMVAAAVPVYAADDAAADTATESTTESPLKGKKIAYIMYMSSATIFQMWSDSFTATAEKPHGNLPQKAALLKKGSAASGRPQSEWHSSAAPFRKDVPPRPIFSLCSGRCGTGTQQISAAFTRRHTETTLRRQSFPSLQSFLPE